MYKKAPERGFEVILITNKYYFNVSTLLLMSSAIEVLLNTADKANINTANITVVSLNPLEDGLFILYSCKVRLFYFLA